MRVGRVVQLWRYPVKSMAGERLQSTSISPRGIPGDRGWALYDEARGGVTNGKRLAALRLLQARYPEEPVVGEPSPTVEITFPDGSSLTTESTEVARRVSDHVGRAVTFRSLGPAGTEAARRLLYSEETPETQRVLNGLLPGEPMPDFSDLPAERLQELRRGNFFDALPIHLLTRATLATLARVAPESTWDERRFRPNVLIEGDVSGDYPELAWIGRRVRVGGAVLAIDTGCPRCVMVTQAVDELPLDHRVMRTLVRETKHTAGVYCAVVEAGDVTIGDPVELLD